MMIHLALPHRAVRLTMLLVAMAVLLTALTGLIFRTTTTAAAAAAAAATPDHAAVFCLTRHRGVGRRLRTRALA